MNETELQLLAIELHYVRAFFKNTLRSELTNAVAAQRHLMEHGLENFEFSGNAHLVERVRTLFPELAKKYQ